MGWALYIQLLVLIFFVTICVTSIVKGYFAEVRKTETEVGTALRELDAQLR